MQPRVICLTVEGLERFATELKDIASVRRLAVTERLRRARVVLSAHHGADYEDARFEPARVEQRARSLEILPLDAQCITDRQSGDRVELGSKVTLVDLDSGEPQQSAASAVRAKRTVAATRYQRSRPLAEPFSIAEVART